MTHSPIGCDFCPECGKPRSRVVELMGKPYLLGVMCDCDAKAEADGIMRMEAQHRERARANAFYAKAMSSWRFEIDDKADRNASATCLGYAQRFADMKAKGYGLLLFGVPDQGKSFLSACIANEVIDAGYSAIMRSVPSIVAKSRGFGDDTIDEMAKCDLLILDDLGAERDTSFSREVVYRAVESRYADGRSLVVSTNLTIDMLRNPGDVDTERIYNRVLERCLPVRVDSGRKRATKEKYAEIRKAIGV